MASDFTNAFRLLEEKRAKTYLSTSCSELDNLMGSGVEPGCFYLFYGDPENGIDQLLHQLIANALGLDDETRKVVYLNCGNYREDKTILNIPLLTNMLKAKRLDPSELLDNILVYCAFSEEQQEQVVEEVRQAVERIREVGFVGVHNVAKLFVPQDKRDKEWYKRIPKLQKAVLQLWQMCAFKKIVMVASCRAMETRRGVKPRPEGGRYLSHEANVIVYLERVGKRVPTIQAYLVKHPAKPGGSIVLKVNGEIQLERIALPFKVKFDQELKSLGSFRDALRSLEMQAAYDEIVQVCTSEQGALANTDIPAILDAMLLATAVSNRRLVDRLSKRVDALEEEVRRLRPQAEAKW